MQIVKKVIVAMRGRDKDNPSLSVRSNDNFEQRLEVNNGGDIELHNHSAKG